MGIQDRDYYREGPSVLDSLMPTGIVCRWLIAINIAVFFLQLVAQSTSNHLDANGLIVRTQGWVTDWFILDPLAVRDDGQVWRLLSYAFLHDTNGIWHLVFNMVFLWWFGSDIEQLYGRREFLAIFLISAMLGGVTFLGWSIARESPVPCLGASGAVTTLLVLSALHFPKRIIYFFGIVPVPIWLFAALSVAKDAFAWAFNVQTQTAVTVHLAGAVFAVAYYQWQGSIVDLFSRAKWWNTPKARPRLKLYNPESHSEEPVGVAATSVSQTVADEHLEAKLDAVLEKIANKGKDSLTAHEEEILRQAAAMYKRRRG